MSAAKDPNEIVWAVHDGIHEAGEMTRAHIALSSGWKEADATHPKVKAVLTGVAYVPTPDAGTSKEK